MMASVDRLRNGKSNDLRNVTVISYLVDIPVLKKNELSI
jgi:hypothetical protein